MQIVIPMSGSGQRFRNAGYKQLKPLIEVDGKPMIEHVVSMFPGEIDFTFICDETHLEQYPVEETLRRIAPQGRIIPIASHKKGPVYAVSQAFSELRPDEPTIVNYCDFYSYWHYADFKRFTEKHQPAGVVAAYRGFHPHMLGMDNYAFIKSSAQRLEAIQEKKPFTDNRMAEYASNGTYYFSKGEYLERYFKQLMTAGEAIFGEYYVSMVYNKMVRDALPVWVYEVQHMLQWGTPKDLAEYMAWSDYFREALHPQLEPKPESGSLTLIPMAGEGRRFVEQGYCNPKPLIPLSGLPMVVQASRSLPPSENYRYVCQSQHLREYTLERVLHQYYPNACVVALEGLTEGQACTCALGLQDVDPKTPLLIGACDNSIRYDAEKFQTLRDDPDVDAIVFTFRHHPGAQLNPQMYGWVRVDEQDNVLGVSVKAPISDTPAQDHAIVGAFYFKQANYFQEALQSLISKNSRVNNEFYVDSCIGELIQQRQRVKVFEVSQYLCWGTPNDYETFHYWQSFFHKCDWHPYTLALDATVAKNQVAIMDRDYRSFQQPEPCPSRLTTSN